MRIGGRAPAPAGSARGERPGAIPPAVWLVWAIAAIVGVGVADELTSPDVSLILFYLAPIAVGTWFVSPRAGVALSILAAAVAFAADGLHQLGAGDRARYAVLAWNGAVQVGTSLAIVATLAALRDRLGREELLARTDALTQIQNRRAFFEAASLEVERARRSGLPITAAYVDVDDFKDVNDRLGHARGDALLVAVAQTLRSGTRTIDAVARLGGDEFGLVLPDTDPAEAERLLVRLRAALVDALAGGGWNVGVSIGAATFLSPPSSVDEMMARADELMYAAKRDQKGSIRRGVFPGAGRANGGSAAVS
ncbi:MAG TPA: GGDEF domain-containing protein [Anaeromyxobacter sp.]|nr:GGDEF domain-containing protein [Anaeromyxobacter sp.]